MKVSSYDQGKFAQRRAIAWVIAGLFAFTGPGLAWSQPASPPEPADAAQPSPPTAKPAGRYYVEFRVGQIGTYGHSYAVYGVEGGRQNYADLHPMGGYAGMAVGHVLPVPANTQWNPEVLKLPIVSRYRRVIGADQYRKLLAAVQSAKANKAYWNAVTYNCNHFIGLLAEAVGLRVPGQFQVSYSFVPALKELNEGARDARSGTSPKRRAAPPPPT